jgi:hypothetical protein
LALDPYNRYQASTLEEKNADGGGADRDCAASRQAYLCLRQNDVLAPNFATLATPESSMADFISPVRCA